MLGAGSIGGNIGLRLVDTGHDVHVCDVSPLVRSAFDKRGVRTSWNGRNFTSKSFAEAVQQYAAFITPPEGFYSLIDIVTKDLKIIKSLAEATDVSLPMLSGIESGVHGMHDRAVASRVFDQWQKISDANQMPDGILEEEATSL